MPRSRSQPIPPLPPRRRLLASMVAAPGDAAALLLARHGVQHLAAAPDQNRRPRRRVENAGQNPPAVERPRSGDLRHAAQPPAAPGHLKTGAGAPPPLPSRNLQPRPDLHRRIRPAASLRLAFATKTGAL